MENSPLTVEDNDDSNESGESATKNKKKSRLGLFAVKNEAPEDKKTWFEKYNEEQEEKKEREKEKKEEEKAETAGKPKLELVDDDKDISSATKEASAEAVDTTEPETEMLIETPSEEELSEVVRPKLVEVIEELEADQEADPVTDPPVEKFREKIKSGEDPEEAFDEVLEDLGAEDADLEAVAEADPETDKDVELESLETEESEPEYAEIDLNPMPEAVPEEEDQAEATEPDDKKPSASASGSSSSTQATNAPPHQPPAIPSQSPGTTPDFNSPLGPPPPAGQNLNLMPPPPSTPDVQQRAPEYHQASPAAMALFGGIIGYLIGRRRGRVKTEKKLLPIQKKLEKQVEDLQFDLQQKEKKIRLVAAAKAERAALATDAETTRNLAPEAVALHAPQPKPERIGHVLVKAESGTNQERAPEIKQQATIDKTTNQEVISRVDKRVETLSRGELLTISEKIIIDGTSLRRIFETHLIGENGLRHLVSEQMRGGDLKKALQMEIVEREIDFERDPAVRDMTPAHTVQAGANNASTATLDRLLQKASADMGDSSEQAAFIRAKANFEAEQTHKRQKQRQIIDISFISVIMLLFATIIFILITR